MSFNNSACIHELLQVEIMEFLGSDEPPNNWRFFASKGGAKLVGGRQALAVRGTIRHINRERTKICFRSRLVTDKRVFHGGKRLRTRNHQKQLVALLGQRAFINRADTQDLLLELAS